MVLRPSCANFYPLGRGERHACGKRLMSMNPHTEEAAQEWYVPDYEDNCWLLPHLECDTYRKRYVDKYQRAVLEGRCRRLEKFPRRSKY